MVLISLVALDVLLFYVFFEAMLIPMYFLIGGFGGAGRSKAAVKFLLYNLFGGLIMLAAVIGLYVVTASSDGVRRRARSTSAPSSAAVSTGELAVNPAIMNALFLGFMFAFAVKAPLWPFHRWLPDAAVESTPATAVLMMAVVDKVGTFGMLRYCLQLFPDAVNPVPAVDHRAGRHRHRLRRHPGDRPDRRDAADRLHLDLATSGSSSWASS